MSSVRATKRPFLLCAVIFVVTLGVFWPARGFDFVDVDDAAFVTENPMVQRGLALESVRWAFTSFHASNWVPGTFLSLMLDRSVFGPGPAGFHLTNILLHALDAALLGLLALRLGAGRAAAVLVALLFALHPMRVESVAWVSERKDVLSTAFWLVCTLAWVAWVRTRRRRDYALAVLALALGLATKGMLVTLPATLLILDWWPLRREEPWRRRVVEKLPLFGLALCGAAITLIAQGSGTSVTTLGVLGPAERVANALVGYVTYLGRLLWPLELAYFYPHPAFVPPYAGWSAARIASSALVFVAITAGAVALARRGHRFALAGWLWYTLTLLPVIGLVQVGMQSTADRYTYVPQIGLIAIVVGAGTAIARRHRRLAGPLLAGGAVVVAASAALTARELPHWRDSEALFGRALEVTGNNGVALDALGAHLARKGELEEARLVLERAVRAQPLYAEAHADLGIVLAALGADTDAARHLRRALEALPQRARVHVALANVLARQGHPSEATRHYRMALERDPRSWAAHFGLGQIARLRRQPDLARQHFRKALELAPDPNAQAKVRSALE